MLVLILIFKIIGGITAFHMAIKDNNIELAKELINAGADLNIQGKWIYSTSSSCS